MQNKLNSLYAYILLCLECDSVQAINDYIADRALEAGNDYDPADPFSVIFLATQDEHENMYDFMYRFEFKPFELLPFFSDKLDDALEELGFVGLNGDNVNNIVAYMVVESFADWLHSMHDAFTSGMLTIDEFFSMVNRYEPFC